MSSRAKTRRLAASLLWVLGAAVVPQVVFADAPASSATAAAHAARAQVLIQGLDYEEARKELAAADPEDPAVALERGRLAIYEQDCDGALAILARPDIGRSEEGQILSDIARGCARVTAATIVERDDLHAVEVRFQDEGDRALVPLLVDTVVHARDALTRDLGVTWPKPTRVVVVRDLLSLSAMTGLPYDSARTTGTVAVAKWGRVTLLSPRASEHGYVWRDTVTHELTHLAVTRATNDRAPLWLQEGMAKREEVRWRPPGPFDDRPPPEAVVARGIELKLDLPLDRLGPSIAMLPSADAAMVAFAEVTSFVRYFADTSPPDAVPRLLLALREGKSVDDALRSVSGNDMKQWDAKWRGWLASSHHEAVSSSFGLGAAPPGLREARDRVRLAELLFGRGHPAEALAELDRIKPPPGRDPLAEDPSLRYLRGRCLLAPGRQAEAAPLLADPKEVVVPHAPWWALRGFVAREAGDGPKADASFSEAISSDPFDVEGACQALVPLAPGSAPPSDEPTRVLCEAARTWDMPALGRE